MTVVEKRSPVDGAYTRSNLVFARDGGDGVPNRYRFNERGPDRRVPEPDGNSRHRRSRDSVHRSGFGTIAQLPTWYQYLAIVATITAIVVFLVVSSL